MLSSLTCATLCRRTHRGQKTAGSSTLPRQDRPRLQRTALEIIQLGSLTSISSIPDNVGKFIACEDLKAEAIFQAYPVCKGVANELFVVATASDFEVAQRLQHRTKAAKARLQLSQVISANHQILGSWIVVTMPDQAHEKLANCIHDIATKLYEAKWTFDGIPLDYDEVGAADVRLYLAPGQDPKTVQPDGSLVINRDGHERERAFLILEARHTQTDKSLKQKVLEYAYGSKRHIRVICCFHLVRNHGVWRVLMDVIKVRVIETISPRFRVIPAYVLKDEPIYPVQSTLSFEICREEVLPRDWIETTRHPQIPQKVTVPLSLFYANARKAVLCAQQKKTDKDNKRQSSNYDENMELPPVSVSGVSGGGEAASAGDNEDVGAFAYDESKLDFVVETE
ncbi:MAG: hypothetical protein Q9184_007955 [Pyrenodesmia sp. 2 TL-2023]